MLTVPRLEDQLLVPVDADDDLPEKKICVSKSEKRPRSKIQLPRMSITLPVFRDGAAWNAPVDLATSGNLLPPAKESHR